jgi:competence protein ComEC
MGLALAALLILALRPGDLEDPGFQLSFAATTGIVLAPLPRSLVAGALAVSGVAQLAVLPITLTHFNQLSTIGVLVNLGVVPLAGVATVVGLLGVTLSFVSGTIAQVALDAVWPVLVLLRAIVALAASVPGAIVHLPAPGPGAIALYAGALLGGVVAWRVRGDWPRRARALGGAAATALVAALALAAWPLMRPADGWLRVTVLDVGQGDAIVVEAPNGRALLIDAGGGGPMRLDAGERVVAPFLWNRGILTLAGVVTTHADADHAGGAASVRRLFTTGDGWDAESLAAGPRSLAGVTISSLPRPRSRGTTRPWC